MFEGPVREGRPFRFMCAMVRNRIVPHPVSRQRGLPTDHERIVRM